MCTCSTCSNMSRVYTLAEISSKLFVKKQRKIGDLIYDHGLTNFQICANLIFNEIYYGITACICIQIWIKNMGRFYNNSDGFLILCVQNV